MGQPFLFGNQIAHLSSRHPYQILRSNLELEPANSGTDIYEFERFHCGVKKGWKCFLHSNWAASTTDISG